MGQSAKHSDRYGVAALLIFASMVAMGSVGALRWGGPLAIAIEGIAVLFILWTSAVRPAVLMLAALLVIAAVVAALTTSVRGGSSPWLDAGVGLLLAALAPAAIFARVRKTDRVSTSTIFAALCLYLIAGLLFAYVFAFVNAVDGGLFFKQGMPSGNVDFLYFSLVTLATLGYGDLTPQGSVGKMLAVTEALAGQLYLVSIVALLVSNIGRERRTSDQQDKDSTKEAR